MKKLICLSLATLCTSNLAYADTYQSEISASYFDAEATNGVVQSDSDGWGIAGTYYLDSVDNSKGPLALASFLDRASGLSFSYSSESDEGSSLDRDSHAVVGHFVDKKSGWLFDIGFSNTDTDDPDSDTDELMLRAGKYVAENTTVSVSYVLEEDGDDNPGSEDLDTWAIEVAHVKTSENGFAHEINAFVGRADIGSDNIDASFYGGDYTIYPNRNIGIGAGIARVDSDFEEAFTYTVFADWFVMENISLGVSYLNTETDEADIEIETFNVTASVRF